MNEIKSKYSSLLFIFENFNDIDYLFKFNINFSQIKKLKFSAMINSKKEPDKSYCSYKTVFSHNDIKNNLIYLKLDSCKKFEIENNSFEPLNDFKVLEELILQHFKFKNNFSLKLKNLKNLELNFCENISFENCCLNLYELKLVDYNITPPKSLLQFPKLESCILDRYTKMNYNLLIDFKSLKNLKNFSAPGIYFLNLENDLLISATCYFNDLNEIIAKKLLNKLLSFKYLKNLYLKYFEMNIYEISKFEGHNDSIIYLLIENRKNCDEINFDFLQNKFPNLSSFYLENSTFEHEEMDLEIIENKKSKINDIVIDCKFGQIKKNKIYCQSYETLKYFGLEFDRIYDFKKVLPIFDEKCEIKFKELIIFSFKNEEYETNIDVLKNIYNNIR